jgi:glycosyltransferase involved in cell wall biosynthesis
MKISALVPVYSETDLLVQTLERLKKVLGPELHEFLICVSPKSTPECLALCRELPLRDPVVRSFVQSDKSGIGVAYRELIPHITGTHGLILSSDLETDPADAARIVATAQDTGADIVCASRWTNGGSFEGYDPFKLVLNYGYNMIFRTLYGLPVTDITFGYKLIRTEVLQNTVWEYDRHEFCAEVLLKPVRLGYTAAETWTKWVKRPDGESKNTFMRNFKFASAAWKIRFGDPSSWQTGRSSTAWTSPTQ